MGGKGIDTTLASGAIRFAEEMKKMDAFTISPVYQYFPEDDHNEAAWAKRFPMALECYHRESQSLYKNKNIDTNTAD